MEDKSIYFNDRDGHTVLSREEQDGLLLDHITSIKELDEAEHMNIEEGLLWLSDYKGEVLDEIFWRKLHKKLFGQVWKWAGVYRTSDKNIGIEYFKVIDAIKKIEDNTSYWIEHSTYEPIEITARFHHSLVEIHPFPNGNGRFSRILTNLLCTKQGWHVPSWGKEIPKAERRNTYIKALQEADMNKYSNLIEFVSK